MKHKTNITNCRFRYLRSWILSVLFLFYALFLPTSIALSQNEPDVNYQPYNINGKEVKQYLVEKYELKKHDVTSTLKQTLYGPEGKVYLRGKITPRNVAIAAGITDIKDRARAIAKVFLEEEASLFGITNMEEIREIKITTDKGYGGEYVHIRYLRYINNLELEDANIIIRIGPDEKISWVRAEVVPISSELYEAVKKKILTEGEILKIVKQDLESAGVDPKEMRVLSIKKVAIPSPTYVIWKADINLKKGGGRWKYRIDAFTGEILEKRDALIIN